MISWIAALAILLSGLMPLISQVLDNVVSSGRVDATEWREVCSTTGSKWINLNASSKPVNIPSILHAKYCDYCFTNAASFALPPANDVGFFAPAFSFYHFSQLNSKFLLVAAWLAPSVRAPPFRPFI
ncbi:DUF2946 domain-containing protein [Undibacterium sp. SXout11W]|uniref:DUF2946 domain-containing protein n=1 Tax=Undibacterium sp. SXout11W TaxID=3413050 RepID=UPI003BF189EB